MALSGAKPREDRSTVQNRSKVEGWTEVDNVPFDGPWPDLPDTFSDATGVYGPEDTPIDWLPFALQWFNTMKRLPQAALWEESDWNYLIATVPVVQRAMGSMNASWTTELRNREKKLGATWSDRRDMRLRYVDPKSRKPELAPVRAIDSVRDL